MSRPPALCAACGAPVEAAFCTSCGTRVAQAPAQAPAQRPHNGDVSEQTVVRPRPPHATPGPGPSYAPPPPPLPPQPTRPLFGDDPRIGTPRVRGGDAPTSLIPLETDETHTGVLGFRVEETGPVPPVAPRNGRRALVAGIFAFVVLVALGVGGTFGYLWWRDRPLNQALTAAGEATDAVLDQLSGAEDLDDVAAAGTSAQRAVATVEKAAKDIADVDVSYADEAREVLADQAELLRAVAPVSELGADAPTVWGSALPVLLEAQDGLVSSRRALEEADSGAADQVPDPRRPIAHTIDVVGSSATGALTTQLDGMLTDLSTARNTPQVAAIGERAAVVVQAAEAAATGQDGVTASTLTHLTQAFSSLALLGDMSPENLAVWDLASPDLTSATEAVGLDPEPALTAMEKWVNVATQRVDEWRLAYAEAEAERSTATAGLDDYAEAVRGVLREYQQARDTLEDQVTDDTAGSYDIEWAMEAGYSTRLDLHSRLTDQWPPQGMEDAHRRLDVLLGDAVTAMSTGYDAVSSWNACWYECSPTYTDQPGWQTFSAESKRIAEEFAAARKQWNSALTQALRAANATPLPPMPEV